MTYKILSTGNGIITTRQPKVIKDNATFLFVGAPNDATVVFSMLGATYYRVLNEGRCNIPVKYLDGKITVSITQSDRSAKIKRYVCEGLEATKLTDGVMLVPDDSNLAEEFAKMKVENDNLNKEFEILVQKFEDLKLEFNKMMQGYGLL